MAYPSLVRTRARTDTAFYPVLSKGDMILRNCWTETCTNINMKLVVHKELFEHDLVRMFRRDIVLIISACTIFTHHNNGPWDLNWR